MPLDVNKYRPYLDEFDLTDEQKTAMIEALWSIAESVVDLAYCWNSEGDQAVAQVATDTPPHEKT